MARAYTPPTDPLLRRPRHPVDRAEVGTARFYAHLPPRPERPFTLEKAIAHLAAIMALLEAGRPPSEFPFPQTEPWTRSEQKNLYRIARVWRRRAEGNDPRWLLMGSRGGRLARTVEKALQPPPDPAWTAPDHGE